MQAHEANPSHALALRRSHAANSPSFQVVSLWPVVASQAGPLTMGHCAHEQPVNLGGEHEGAVVFLASRPLALVPAFAIASGST